MIYVHVVVEGQTEETFVRDVLQPYFTTKQIYLTPIIVQTKRLTSGKKYRGGVVSYQRLKRDILNALNDTSRQRVTTMIDYYGLNFVQGFPGWDTQSGDLYQRVAQVETALADDIGHSRFLPYLQVHEFESLLFTDVDAIGSRLNVDPAPLQTARDAVETPEAINLDAPPSHRIQAIALRYSKVLTGTQIAHDIGLDAMRDQCPHFRDWLEALANFA